MAIPPDAGVLEQVMDPAEVLDYELLLDGTDGILEADEEVDSYTLVLSAEAVALGLQLGTAAYATSQPTPTSLRMWFEVDALEQANPAFDGAGASLPMELTIITNSTPARTRQRTVVLQVAQR